MTTGNSTPSHCTQAPPVLSQLFGRERELELAVGHLASRAKLLTITGAAGIGKTRFALGLAERWREDWPDQRVCFCALADCHSEADATRALALALGTTSDPSAIERALYERATLLIIDSPERALTAISQSVARLLAITPTLTVVCAARARLAIIGEVILELDALGTNDDSAALQMLIDRVGRLRPVSETEHDALARIAQRVEGIPLLIEFAAARLRALSAEELATRLDKDLYELRARLRALPDRHATIDACLRWSYEQLSAHERRALEACSVFRGPFSLRAAEAVIGGDDAVDALVALRDASLVRVLGSDARGGARFAMFTVIARFAAERAAESGQAPEAQRRMIQHYGDEATDERVLQWIATPQDSEENDEDRAQLLAVVEYVLERRDPSLALAALRARLCTSFDSADRKETEAARQSLEALTELASQTPERLSPIIAQQSRIALAFAQSALGELDASEHTLDAIEHEAQSDQILGFVAYLRALNAFKTSRPRVVVAQLEQAAQRFARLGDHRRCAAFDATIAQTLATLGDPHWEQRSARAEQLAVGLRDARLRVMVLSKRAASLLERGRLEEARSAAERVLQLSDDHQLDERRWMALGTLGEIAHERGDVMLALRLYNETLRAANRANARDIALIRAYRAAAQLALGEVAQAAAALAQQVDALDQCGDDAHAVVFRGWLAAAWAQSDRDSDARALLDAHAAEAMPETPTAPWLAAWMQRVWLAPTTHGAMNARVERFAPIATTDEQRTTLEWIAANHADVRLVRSWIRHRARDGKAASELTEALVVAADGSWFEAPSEARVSLASRSTMRAILLELAKAACECAGRAVSARTLIEAAWPGEKIRAASSQNRLQVALSSLRRLGLRSWIQHTDEGYMLTPARPVRMVDSTRDAKR